MKKALLLYSGVDGQTFAIASKIMDNLSSQFSCALYPVDQLPQLNLSDYELIVIGAAIRYGYFNKKFQRFVAQNANVLNQQKTVFFSVTLTARKPEKRMPETNLYTRKFLDKTPWQPKLSGVFAGALHYPRYKWFDRTMIRLIMRITGGETDITQDIEYTDWQQVDDFSGQILSLAEESGK